MFFDKILGYTPEEWQELCQKFNETLDIEGLFSQAEYMRQAALSMPFNGIQKWKGQDYMEKAFSIYRKELDLQSTKTSV